MRLRSETTCEIRGRPVGEVGAGPGCWEAEPEERPAASRSTGQQPTIQVSLITTDGFYRVQIFSSSRMREEPVL